MAVVFEENGCSEITPLLLGNHNVVCCRGRRQLSNNLEIFIMVEISSTNVKVIGRLVPGFPYKDTVPIEEG